MLSSHGLARLLLTLPDLPVATHAHGHTYMESTNAGTHGPIKVGLMHTYGGDHLVIGNFWKRDTNGENDHVMRMYHGKAPWKGRESILYDDHNAIVMGQRALASIAAACTDEGQEWRAVYEATEAAHWYHAAHPRASR